MANDLTTIRQELDAITKLIAETVPAERIYLFGSYAYGTPHKYSDLDFYVVLKPGTEMRAIDASVNIRLAIKDAQNMPVDVLTKHHDDFWARVEAPTMEKTIFQKGVLLYG